jgi:hypothetical protein
LAARSAPAYPPQTTPRRQADVLDWILSLVLRLSDLIASYSA